MGIDAGAAGLNRRELSAGDGVFRFCDSAYNTQGVIRVIPSTDGRTIMPLTIQTDPIQVAPDATGTIRVAGTRVTLETLVEHYRAGATAEDLRERFPVLSAADVYAVLAYYLRHQDEVETYLVEQSRQAEAALTGLGGHHQPWDDVSKRLQARQGPGTGDDASLPC
jgi:uncharacterized protein (DUF433 family)